MHSWHEILATGCLHVPALASTLFGQEAYRAAFELFWEEDLCDDEDFFVDVLLDVFDDDFFDEDFDDTVFVLAACLLREVLFAAAVRLRARVEGASFTGSATVSVCPTVTVLDERWFQ